MDEVYTCICGFKQWMISSDGLLMCSGCGREYQLPMGITIHEDQVMRVFLEPKEFNENRENLSFKKKKE